MSNPQDNFQCHARRHMTPSQFVTYDTIVAMSKKNKASAPGDLVFYGRLTTLANYTGRSVEQERQNIEKLIQSGWLMRGTRSRWTKGLYGTNRYDVIEHDEFIADAKKHPDKACPPYRYDPHTGQKVGKGKSPKFNLAQHMKEQTEIKDAGF